MRRVAPLSTRWTPSTAPSGQDVPGQERDNDDRRRNSDDRDGGGSDEHRGDHISQLFRVDPKLVFAHIVDTTPEEHAERDRHQYKLADVAAAIVDSHLLLVPPIRQRSAESRDYARAGTPRYDSSVAVRRT
jgi:hypothetical protein